MGNFYNMDSYNSKLLQYVINTSLEVSLKQSFHLKIDSFERSQLECTQKWCVRARVNPSQVFSDNFTSGKNFGKSFYMIL